MKINLQILAEELAPLTFERALSSAPDVFPFAMPKPFCAGSTVEDSYVYIARAADLPVAPAIDGPHPSLICIGEPPADYRSSGFDMLVTHDEITVLALLDRALEVFERYDAWGRKMQALLDENAPLKRLGEVSYPFFNNPIYFQGSGFKCIFYVFDKKDLATSKNLNFYYDTAGNVIVPDGSYLPLDAINELISDPEYVNAINATGPTIYSGEPYGFRCLFYNIGVASNSIARLCIDETCRDLTEKDYALIAILGDYLEKGLRGKDFDNYDRPKDLDLVLESLLDHHLVDEQRIIDVLTAYRWNVDDSYFCMVMESKSEDHHWKTLKTLALQLTSQLPSECYLVFDERLVFVFNLTQTQLTKDDVLERSIPLFRDNLLSAGISETFADFKYLYYFYQQAISALTLGKLQDPMFWYFPYGNYNLDNFITRGKGKQIIETFLPRGLRLLMAHDHDTGSDLVALLHDYLDCNMSITETTRKAYIHRNTCMYRVKRIEEISKLNLEDPDVRLELQIAFKLMEG